MLIASSQGGVNIEEVAVENPDAILYEPIDIAKGLTKEQAVAIAEKVGLGNVSDTISQTLLNMYDLFIKKDALLIEINPYAEDAFDNSKCKLHIASISSLKPLMNSILFRNFDLNLQISHWMPNSVSMTLPNSVKRNYSSCAISAKKIRRKWPQPNTI